MSATWASRASAGWQQAKISSSRSSGISASSLSGCSSASRSSCSALRSSVRSRRIRSIARFRAVVMIQAPGFDGTPSRGHRSTRRGEGVLDRVLGKVEVAEDAAEDRDRPRELIPVRGRDGVDQLTSAWRITTGRTSILPVRALGIRAAHSIASSRDSASIR